MFRWLRRMPLFKLLAIAQTALLVREHLQRLDAGERRRLTQLVRRGPKLDRREREELRRLVGKLEPRAFAVTTASRFSPLPLPRRLAGRSAR
ncbi:MAG: hypothetical protein QOE60_609 [Thermoleophilaceae bacterium]|jgi:hypothetical protein|nr:hypothetical protein [Thermoleophilaceae bacterium]